jgi:LysR family transcriptional regulator, carnitine catabolism transcriptional activator
VADLLLDAVVTRRSNRTRALPEVNSRQLAAVLAVSEFRSFIAAAAHLGVSQPALTLTIKRLEQTLGLPLFLRSTRQITLTVAGREFVSMAERVLTDLKLGLQSLRELTEHRRGQVIVSSLMALKMSSVITEYTRRFPGVEIQLREGFRDDVREDVRSGLADFGVG